MKVLYDHQIFSQQDYGGISRYFVESCLRLKSYPDVFIKGGVLYSNNEYLLKDNLFSSHTFLKDINFKGKRRIYYLLNRMTSVYALKTEQYDVFHPTYYDPYYLKLTNRKPVVLTCYDLIHEKFLKHDTVMLKKKSETLKQATLIIAISESTKNDLIEIYGMDESRIKVVHLASSLQMSSVWSAPASVEKRYFLYVGLRNEYKNFLRFVDALAPLLVSNSDLYLYCAGGGSFSSKELTHFKDLRILDKIKLYPGDDISLATLYSGAIAFFYPSLYEGFGIPLIEAMNCNCPIATSNVSSLPEVAGEAALYFDPTSVDSIQFAAESFLNNDSLRVSLIEKGQRQSKKFSWDQTALKTYDLYKAIL